MRWWRRWRRRRKRDLIFEPRVIDMDKLIVDLNPDVSQFATLLLKVAKDERGGVIEW